MKLKEAALLFVEDEPLLRESMGAWLLQKAGRVLCAKHGAEALEILAANKIDLIISDVRMPVMDGVAMVKALRATGGRVPPVIFITGFSDLSSQAAHEIGVDAIVEKPIDREELLRTMQQSLTAPDERWRTDTAFPAGRA